MDGQEKVNSRLVCFHCFLNRCLEYIRGPGIFYVNSMVLEDFTYRKGQTQCVVLLLASVVNCAGIASPMCRVLLAQIFDFPQKTNKMGVLICI